MGSLKQHDCFLSETKGVSLTMLFWDSKFSVCMSTSIGVTVSCILDSFHHTTISIKRKPSIEYNPPGIIQSDEVHVNGNLNEWVCTHMNEYLDKRSLVTTAGQIGSGLIQT